MNKRFLLISLGVLSIATAMQARSRSAEEAKLVAAEFYQSQNGLRSASDVEFTLVYSGSENGLRASTGEAPFYVFNIGSADGFVMVSGDDRVAPVIGYSLTSAFNPDNMPSNLRGWLEGYEKQIEYARTLPDKPYVKPETRAGEFPEQVEPLITAKWGQNSPFNGQCPTTAGGQQTLTGCVATAAAQIMYFYKYPANATGEGSYILGNNTTPVSMDQFTFDWDNMLDEYNENATNTQKEAVAELMAACGAGANMQYGTLFSGAYDANMATSFIKNMNYDDNISFVVRDAYSNAEWISLLKEELKEGRPVFYGGVSGTEGGHAFVCDGYAPNNYFHINWGWNGNPDAYYLLDLLNPYDGNNLGYTGFTYQQDAIIGIQPPAENSVSHEKLIIRSFLPQDSVITQGDSLVFTFDFQYATSIPKEIDIKAELEGTDIAVTIEKLYTEAIDYPGYIITLRGVQLEAGTYDLKFYYKESEETEWTEASFAYGSILSKIGLVATDTKIEWIYSSPYLSGSMLGTYITADSIPLGGIYSIRNESDQEYHPTIGFRIQTAEKDTTIYNYDKLYLEPGDEIEYGVIWNVSLTPGRNTIILFTHDDYIAPYQVIAANYVDVPDKATANETISPNDFSIRVYTDRIAVQSASAVRQIELYDISGRLTGSIRGANELPVDGLADGVYIVRVTTDEGVQTEKVILHR